MTKKRLWQIIRLNLRRGSTSRGDWLREKNIFAGIGSNVRYQIRGIPLYPELIKIGSNVNLSSGVQLVTHDAIHLVFNELVDNGEYVPEKVECIEIKDNVFVGANCVVLGGVKIGPNVIISANTLVNRDLEPGGIYGGIPARRIGEFKELWDVRKKGGYPTVKINQYIAEDEVKKAWKSFDTKHK